MKNLNILCAALIAISISVPLAASNDDAGSAPKMPMMGQGNHGHMMTPEQMQQMQKMMSSGQAQQMPMMNPQMMHMMMHGMNPMGYPQMHYSQPGMPMMGQGMGQAMMNPQMMQMHMQHMANMEKRLETIAVLLAQLVELEKAR